MTARKIVVTGAAGLVGQNLVARLKGRRDIELVGIDKHAANVALFRKVHPDVTIIEADVSQPGPWTDSLAGADAVVSCSASFLKALSRWYLMT